MASGAAHAQGVDIFGEQEVHELEGQDIDAQVRLLEALSRAAKKGPKFRVSPDKIFMTLEVDQTSAETVRISNVGDEDGGLKGINSLGAIEGLDISDNCPEVLSPGGYCDIAVRFSPEVSGNIQTVVVASIEERDRSSFDIPIQIQVTEPKPVEDEEESRVAEEEDRPVIVIREPERARGPDFLNIASNYMRGIGGGYATDPGQGIVVITAPDSVKKASFAGVDYSLVRKEVETRDSRYDEAIPYTDASLPVDRSKILTSDRVIKAVLETPVSNVMCGKVVATVESDVYSGTSAEPLIKAGSRAVGRCGSFADERVGIAWSRILTTDGRSITFDDGATATNDASGLGGGLGRVYRSNFDRFVLPIFSTIIDATAGAVYAVFGETESVVTTSEGNVIEEDSALNEGLRIVTEEARGTAQDLIEEIRDVREVMVLPAGSRIDIELMQDVYFKDEREVIRLADTRYTIQDLDVQAAEKTASEDLILVPYRPGSSGPVVEVSGQKFVVQERQAPKQEELEPENPVLSDLRGNGGSE